MFRVRVINLGNLCLGWVLNSDVVWYFFFFSYCFLSILGMFNRGGRVKAAHVQGGCFYEPMFRVRVVSLGWVLNSDVVWFFLFFSCYFLSILGIFNRGGQAKAAHVQGGCLVSERNLCLGLGLLV
jgi:ribosome-associated protein YbcJ (S4-like RNA binding protein)